jgi:hypothetical protein
VTDLYTKTYTSSYCGNVIPYIKYVNM